MNFVRSNLWILLLIAFCAAPLSNAKAATIAVVDVEKIFSEAKAAKSLEGQIKAKREAFQKEFAAKEKELKQSEATLIGDKEKLSAEEFGKKRKEFEGRIMEVRGLFQKRRNSLDKGVSQAMTELRKNIIEAAAKVAEQKKFDVVLTRDSVLIVEKSLDITSDVLKTLDAQITDIKLKVE